ncbi:unnamed protein product [Clonostachys rosea]|uniref:Metallo-beta-lactamase domain-containing protein n=1 Tax=Bionectria ochroleuca TaxID=29856 RepID=A0ABY6URF4_BIOOC|nr:unnamed protein product [Clonostachys rosea]
MATFNVPSGQVAKVRVIDTGSTISCIPASRLMAPPMQGFDHIPTMPSYSFLVESATGKKALFDLSIATDWQDYAPIVANRLKTNGYEIKAEVDVSEVLQCHGVDLKSINSIVWSHWHWDHLGDPSKFPPSTEIVVGPGFKTAFLPAHPTGQQSPVRESDFSGREIREINFDQPLRVGEFNAVDFFGDGSFYVLDTPGHAIGHLGALARTSVNPDTFIFMGGDLCHHSSEMRPSRYLPLPESISHPISPASLYPCPGLVLEKLQKSRGRSANEPFFDPAMGVPVETALQTVRKAQEADGDENVLFIYAHEHSFKEIGELFPNSANDWKKKGWREKMLWAFLRDFKKLVE